MVELGADDPSSKVGSTPNALLRVGSFACDDPWIQEQATVPWDIAVQPMSRGTYENEIDFLGSPRLILYREHYRIRTRLHGLSPPGMFAFAVPLECDGNTTWWGAPLHETGLPSMMPGGMHADFPAGQKHLVALIDLVFFRESLPVDLRDAIQAATCQHVIPTSRDAATRLGLTLNAVLDGAQTYAQALDHPNAVRSMEQDLLDAFYQSLRLPLSRQKRIGRAVRQRGLQKAIEYLRYADTASVSVADLCNVAQVTQRTLEYAFRETFGLTPLGFIHLRRYQATQRDLLAADSKTATVKEIAQSNGFYQMGRFAGRYRELFGESPSHTLNKPPIVLHCRLPNLRELGPL